MQFRVFDSTSATAALASIGEMDVPYRLTVTRGDETRSQAQNRTIHKWFGEVAAHRGDVTPLEVKAECNLTYGVPIKRRDDPDWDSVFGYMFDKLPYRAKLKALRIMDIPVTRDMTVSQLSEYMEQFQSDWLGHGVRLTIPADAA